jgi:hypothetical protein
VPIGSTSSQSGSHPPARHARAIGRSRRGVWPAIVTLGACAALAAASALASAVAHQPGVSATPITAVESVPLLPGAGAAPRIDGSSGHAWAIGSLGTTGEATLLHIPPRGPDSPLGSWAAGEGRLQRVIDLRSAPEALAAYDARVWLVFTPEHNRRDADGVSLRRVDSVDAVPFAASGWTFRPDGATRLERPLPGHGRLDGFVADRHGPVALIRQDDPPTRQLFRLQGSEWVEVSIPGLPLANRSSATLVLHVGTPEGGRQAFVMSLEPGSRTAELHPVPGPPPATAPPQTNAPDTHTPPTTAQIPLTVTLPHGLTSLEPGLVRIASIDGHLITASASTVPSRQDRARVTLTLLTASTAIPIASCQVDRSAAFVPLQGTGRALLVWSRPLTGSTPTPPIGAARAAAATARAFELAEISVITGRTLFEGDARRDGLLSTRDFQVLALLFGILLAGVLFFVLRTDDAANVHLPPGASLASVWSRLAAATLDLIPPLVVGALLFERRTTDILTFTSPSGLWDALAAMAFVLGLAAVHCALAEWLAGRSLGKMLTGLWVVPLYRAKTTSAPADSSDAAPSAHPAPPTDEHPAAIPAITLGQAIVRNLIRWIPLFALLGLLDQNRRHPGDVIARTVVVRFQEPENMP